MSGNENTRPAVISTLKSLIAGQKNRITLAVCLTVIAVLTELIPYWILYLAAEVVLAGTDVSHTLITLATWLALTLVVKYMLLAFAGYFSHLAAFHVLHEVRLGIARALTKMPFLSMIKYSSGALKKIVINDVERLEGFIAHHIIDLVSALTGPLVAAGFLFWLDWQMALAALSTIPLALLVQKMLTRGMYQRVQEWNHAVERLNAATVEYVRGIWVMKTFCQSAASFRLLHDQLSDYHRLACRFTRQAVPAWSFFIVLLTANIFILLPAGLWRLFHGELSLPAFILILMLGTGLLKPMLRITLLSAMGRDLLAGVERMQPFLVDFVLPEQHRPGDSVDNGVYVREVCVHYGQRQVLSDITLNLAPGSFTALVGPSGAGKSTLAWVLAGLLPATSGEVLLNGIKPGSMDDATRATLLALVTQEVFLFQGTLAENLRLARPNASDDELMQVLEVVQARSLIEKLNNGLDSDIGERGLRLSGGERQRIAIARALLAATPVLILDEVTAFADAISEAAFWQALRHQYPHITVLTIAHRLYAVQHADQICVMQAGKLCATGTHDKLLTDSLLYRTLWQSQYSNHAWHIRVADIQEAVDVSVA